MCHNQSDKELRVYQQPALVFTLVTILALAVTGVVTNSFNANENFGICVYGPYPPGCEIDEMVECIRGTTYKTQDDVFTYLLLMATVVSVYGMIRVYWGVRCRMKASRNLSYGETFRETADQRVTEVGVQAILYTLYVREEREAC